MRTGGTPPVNPSLGSKAEANTKGLRRERMEFARLVLTPEAIRFNEVHRKCNKQMDRQEAEIQRQAIKIERLESQVVNYERKLSSLFRLLATEESAFAPEEGGR